MNSRTACVAGVLASFFVIAGATPLGAQNSAPSAAAIAQGLRPAPSGLGEQQGLPTIGSAPPAPRNENFRSTSAPSTAAPAPRPRHHRPAATAAAHPEPAPAGAQPSVSFNTIQFAFGSARLTPGSSATLNNLGEALTHQLADQKKFLIEGHTDAAGGLQYNMALSRRRADAVKDYLVREAGVSAARLETVGKGPTEPIDPRHPYAAANRRVVVVNLGG